MVKIRVPGFLGFKVSRFRVPRFWVPRFEGSKVARFPVLRYGFKVRLPGFATREPWNLEP
jgi:hypothetical protein